MNTDENRDLLRMPELGSGVSNSEDGFAFMRSSNRKIEIMCIVDEQSVTESIRIVSLSARPDNMDKESVVFRTEASVDDL